MAIKIAGTTVIDDSRNINIQTIQVGTNTVTTASDIALSANVAINAENSLSFGMTDGTSGYYRWMFGNTSKTGGTAGGVEKMRLDKDGNLTLAGTVDGVDIAARDADTLDGQHGIYYTDYTDTAIANLVDSSPTTLDTLNELAAALGDDPNFATTVTNSIAEKLPLSSYNYTKAPNGPSGDFNAQTGSSYVSALNSTANSPFGNAWYNLINTRHRGGSSDGNVWGSQIVTGMTSYQDKMAFRTQSGGAWSGWSQVFHDGYHPNADKWTTARTLSLSGDASGSVSWDGSANATLSVTVANDSHNHNHSDGDFTVNGGNLYTGTSTQRVKLGVWSDTTYGIGMKTGYTFGGLNNDYAMSFQMNSDNDRGFWWGDSTHTDAQGAMALTTDGVLNVANNIAVGYGESDTTRRTTYNLDVNGTAGVSSNLTLGDNLLVGLSKGIVNSGGWTRNTTPYGYIEFGPNNATWGHIYTDRPNFYFNKNLYVLGSKVFHDTYHPNADKWTTARTLSLSGDASGSVSWDGSANASLSVTVANDSHTHDGRYYTESEVATFLNRSYISSEQATNLAVGWYTVATNTGDRATARFGIWDINSSDHQAVTFYAAHHFGTDASNTLTVLDNSYFSGNPFRYIRIKDAGTYDGAALQIYIDDASNNVNVAILGDNFQSAGWVLCDWIPDATTPPLVSNYGSFAEQSRIDLNQIAQGGFATTGEIYAGHDTSQHRVFHDGYHPNADAWTTARTLSLSGDASGSVSWDGSANATLSVTVANDSHTHDGRYYTESEADSRFVNTSGDTMSGRLNISYASSLGLNIQNTSNGGWAGIEFSDHSSGSYAQKAYLQMSHSDGNSPGSAYGATFKFSTTETSLAVVNTGEYFAGSTNRVFHDGYHPNADKLTTARNINGVAFDGTANITVADATKLPLSGGTMTGSLTGTDATFSGTVDVNQLQLRDIGDYITFYGNSAAQHSISSRNNQGAATDDLRINSYGALYVNLDSNNNNTSGADFVIGNHGDATSTMVNLFTVSGENGNVTLTGSLTGTSATFTGNLTVPNQIIHSGDTDTYMQFHAADQWRVVTGGAERLEVNNSQITSTEPIHAPSFHGDGSALTSLNISTPLTGLPTGTDATGSDLIPVYDASAGTWEKQTITNAALQGPAGADGAAGAAGVNAAPTGGESVAYGVPESTDTTPETAGQIYIRNAADTGRITSGLWVYHSWTTPSYIRMAYSGTGESANLRKDSLIRLGQSNGQISYVYNQDNWATFNITGYTDYGTYIEFTVGAPFAYAGGYFSNVGAQLIWTSGGVNSWTSGDNTWIAGGTYTLSHSLGVMPKAIQVELVCVTANWGYSVGDVHVLSSGEKYANWGVALINVDSTTIKWGVYSNGIWFRRESFNSSGSMLNSQWRVRLTLIG